jgi:hypothetical protein
MKFQVVEVMHHTREVAWLFSPMDFLQVSTVKSFSKGPKQSQAWSLGK